MKRKKPAEAGIISLARRVSEGSNSFEHDPSLARRANRKIKTHCGQLTANAR